MAAADARRHVARKRFGQHFLTDGAVIDSIIAAIAPEPGQRLVEIGPGLGALTEPLAERLGRMIVVELDRDLARRLASDERLQLVEADALEVDFSRLGESRASLRVVGNLPYNISTPLLFHLLRHVDSIADQHFMLQKEVVERMVAAPFTAAYGRVSVMLQWRYAMQRLFDVAPDAFEPPPKVFSAVVRMTPRAQFASVEPERLREIVQIAFSQRRKLLRHTLGRWLDERKARFDDGFEFDTQRRAEEVPVDEYVALAQRCG